MFLFLTICLCFTICTYCPLVRTWTGHTILVHDMFHHVFVHQSGLGRAQGTKNEALTLPLARLCTQRLCFCHTSHFSAHKQVFFIDSAVPPGAGVVCSACGGERRVAIMGTPPQKAIQEWRGGGRGPLRCSPLSCASSLRLLEANPFR